MNHSQPKLWSVALSTDLSLFSIEVLGLVGREGAAPHDLLRMARRGRILAWAGESQYYTEPKRLAKLGYLTARKEPGKTRERTVYALTDKGLDALGEICAVEGVDGVFIGPADLAASLGHLGQPEHPEVVAVVE